MRIACIGGGPAGLFLASLVRRADPSVEVTVFERNAPDATFGFGVVFSDRTLSAFEAADPETARAIAESAVHWDDIEIRLRGTTLPCGGHGFSAIARRRLLAILQERARAAGARLVFGCDLTTPPALDETDLIAGCDGANSLVRRSFGDEFQTRDRVGAAKYIWFATPRLFDALTFLFEENEYGVFSVHAYPFDANTSAFIVETDEASWRRAGFDRTNVRSLLPGESDLEALAYCEQLFARHLGGRRLLANNSRWLNFHTITNARWHHENVALLGDAAHTAHFSVGSGTKMAMEDAVALAGALRKHASIEEAFAVYEAERRPLVERIQAAAAPSQRWWETFGVHARMPPEQFAFHFLTRSPILSYGSLRARDPRFVRTVERWFADATGASAEEASSALFTPVTIGGMPLQNRIAVAPAPLSGSGRGEASENDLVQLAGYALCGAGLVLVGDAARLPENAQAQARWLSSWRKVVDFIHRNSRARIGLGLLASNAGAARLADAGGFDLVVALPPPGMDAKALPSSVSALRSAWPAHKPLGCQISGEGVVDGSTEAGALVELAHALRGRGCAFASISEPAGAGRTGPSELWLSDRVRNEAGLPTLAAASALRPEEAHAAVLSGRADLIACWPIPGARGLRPR